MLTRCRGSLPGLRISTNPADRQQATAVPKMNPRLSAPTTRSMFFPRNGLASSSTDSASADGVASRGVMSRKRMPFSGKSGMSRMCFLSWESQSMRGSLQKRVVRSEKREEWDHPTSRSSLLFPLGNHRIPQLPQRLVLDLPHALPRQADAGADLLQGHRVLAVEAVAELEDLGLALVDHA